jgi:hypothetical protein
MPVERNGITLFRMDEKYLDHPAFKALSEVSLGDVKFPFGFFIVDDGKKKSVIPGTKEDRDKRLLTAFPNSTPEARAAICIASTWHEYCEDACHELRPHHECMRIYDDPFHYFACACVLIE